ncbi:MAG: hypothetical protein ABI789_00195 [Usitatibacter sp.]
MSIPRAVLRSDGRPDEARVVLEATADGAIVMRQAAVYPSRHEEEARQVLRHARLPRCERSVQRGVRPTLAGNYLMLPVDAIELLIG